MIADYKNPDPTYTSSPIQFWRYLADIKNISNTYPYGKSYGTNAIYNAADDYRYGFNGMEKEKNMDASGDITDFGARVYDANFPMFLSRDPLEREFPLLSPFQFASNNPIYLIDLDGKEGIQYLEKTVYPNGEVEIKRIIESNVHVAVDDAWFSFDPHYQYDDVEKVKKQLNNEFNSECFYDHGGYPIEFRFNVSSFDVDDILPKDLAREFRDPSNLKDSKDLAFTNNGINHYVKTIMNLVIQKRSISSSGVKGKRQGFIEDGNLITIGKGGNNESHNVGHETLHFLLSNSLFNPKTVEEHNNRGGGLLQDKDLENGKDIEPLNQNDIFDILNYVPNGEDRTIEK